MYTWEKFTVHKYNFKPGIQTCTNETSVAFTPLKIKINKICLIWKNCASDCITSKGVEIMQKQQFHTFLNYFQKLSCSGIICSSGFLNHYPKCLIVFIFHPSANTVTLSHS